MDNFTVCFHIGVSSTGEMIADCQSDNKADYDRVKANAHLMKAAPEMYHRLKEVKSNFRALLFNPYISKHTRECIEVMIDHIENDLKKARGEE